MTVDERSVAAGQSSADGAGESLRLYCDLRYVADVGRLSRDYGAVRVSTELTIDAEPPDEDEDVIVMTGSLAKSLRLAKAVLGSDRTRTRVGIAVVPSEPASPEDPEDLTGSASLLDAGEVRLMGGVPVVWVGAKGAFPTSVGADGVLWLLGSAVGAPPSEGDRSGDDRFNTGAAVASLPEAEELPPRPRPTSRPRKIARRLGAGLKNKRTLARLVLLVVLGVAFGVWAYFKTHDIVVVGIGLVACGVAYRLIRLASRNTATARRIENRINDLGSAAAATNRTLAQLVTSVDVLRGRINHAASLKGISAAEAIELRSRLKED